MSGWAGVSGGVAGGAGRTEEESRRRVGYRAVHVVLVLHHRTTAAEPNRFDTPRRHRDRPGHDRGLSGTWPVLGWLFVNVPAGKNFHFPTGPPIGPPVDGPGEAAAPAGVAFAHLNLRWLVHGWPGGS